MINKAISYFTQHPKTLFILDSIGALLTASLLYLVVSNFYPYFGVPQNVVNIMAGIALCLSLFSGIVFLVVKQNYRPWLTIIGLANLGYCIVTLGGLLYYNAEITLFGIAYFAIEVAVIVTLSKIEFTVANRSIND